MRPLPVVSHLSDVELVARVAAITAKSHAVTAELLVHLAEVEAREIHLQAACGSMFAYVTRVLGFDEAAAYKRITAHHSGARDAVPELPAGARALGPGPTAFGRHRPVGPPSHRGQPPRTPRAGRRQEQARPRGAHRRLRSKTRRACPGSQTARSGRGVPQGKPVGPGRARLLQSVRGVKPVGASPARAAVGRPIPGQVHGQRDVGRQARADASPARSPRARLRSGAGPRGGRRAASCHAAQAPQRGTGRSARGARPRAAGQVASRTRHVPKTVRREVVERDGLACAYVDPATGRRCGSRDRLELQHHQPFGRDGEHDAHNLSLYCHAHNAMAARRDYGAAYIEAKIQARSDARSGN